MRRRMHFLPVGEGRPIDLLPDSSDYGAREQEVHPIIRLPPSGPVLANTHESAIGAKEPSLKERRVVLQTDQDSVAGEWLRVLTCKKGADARNSLHAENSWTGRPFPVRRPWIVMLSHAHSETCSSPQQI